MDVILRGYQVNEPTWFYLSFLLIVAVFFRFHRLWSLRNIDLGLMLLISPGLLFVPLRPVAGYSWLFVVSVCLLARTLWDGMLTRRPRLEPNLNSAGLMFLCVAAFAFLMTKATTEPPSPSTLEWVGRPNQLLQRSPEPPQNLTPSTSAHVKPGPGSSLLAAPVVHLTNVVTQPNVVLQADGSSPDTSSPDTPRETRPVGEVIAARTIAILAHLAVVLGLIFVGRHVFADFEAGLAMATLYLLLPCTAYDVAKVNHALPAALIVWAVWAYRRPFVSGTLFGLACGTMFFPAFLLPLWIAFYGRRGAVRFCLAVGGALVVMIGSLVLTSIDGPAFGQHVVDYIDWVNLQFRMTDSASGFWSNHETAYRIPVFVSFVVLLVALTIWPHKKSLSHLLASSAAIIIGTQFWYPEQGGVYVLWYLPMLLMVVFRPALLNHIPPEIPPFNWRSKILAWLPARRELTTSSTTSDRL